MPELYDQRSYHEIPEYIENEMESIEQLHKALLKRDFYQNLVKLKKDAMDP